MEFLFSNFFIRPTHLEPCTLNYDILKEPAKAHLTKYL